MSRKQSEIGRFLAWFNSLGDEAKRIVGDQVRDAIRTKKPQVSRRNPKITATPSMGVEAHLK